MIRIYLKAVSDWVAEVQTMLDDATEARWTGSQIKVATNRGLNNWADHGVQTPRLYTFSPSATVREYTLPEYLRGPITVQEKQRYYDSRLLVNVGDGTDLRWVDIGGWHVEPDAAGDQILRLDYYPSTDGMRAVWWSEPAPVPTAAVTLNADITAAATSLVLDAVYSVADSGWVKVDNEWMEYNGQSDDGSNTTLAGLVRGVRGSTAAAHTASKAVSFVLAATRRGLFEQLMEQVLMVCHGMKLTSSPGEEIERHQWALRLHRENAETWWRTWTPDRGAVYHITREAMGL